MKDVIRFSFGNSKTHDDFIFIQWNVDYLFVIYKNLLKDVFLLISISFTICQ